MVDDDSHSNNFFIKIINHRTDDREISEDDAYII